MTINASLYLKPREERRLLAGHCWIFSNEIDVDKAPIKSFTAGELVKVFSSRQQPLGIAYVNPHTLLCGRLLSRNINQAIDENFFVQRITHALALRDRLFSRPYYRLIFGESDGLPGLVVDRFGDHVVAQMITAGMENLREKIIAALVTTLKPHSILLRNNSSQRSLEKLETYVSDAYGTTPEQVILEENSLQFIAPLRSGQKTGWFFDHRDNRAALARYVKNKRVLDVFSYLGGWGICAAAYGASEVTCVDSSELALALARKNAELNQVADRVNILQGDAFEILTRLLTQQQQYDVILLDPPAFIKKRKDEAAGMAAYLRLNEMAMRLLPADGILITSSCSLHLPMPALVDIVRRAGNQSKRWVQIIAQGFQGADHPIHPAINETSYLKTLFCRVSI